MDPSNDSATVTLKPVGDVELWYAEAPDCTWRLPVHVEWKQDPTVGSSYGLILPGTCFYEVQTLTMQALLGRHSLLDDRTDRWLVPRHIVQALLRKAPGIHAEFYYDWPDGMHPPIPSHHSMSVAMRPPATKFDSFGAYVSAQHHIPLDVVNVVLASISTLGTEWMVRYHRTIDLGFVRLVAVPFRANWKEIVMFKGKTRDLLDALLLPKRERLQRLGQIRFPATLCSAQNIALVGGAKRCRFDYSIEAMTTGAFDEAVEVIEENRKGGCREYEKIIERLYETIVDCLARYARKTQAAWAAVRKGGDGSGTAFVASRPKPCRGVHPDDLPVDIVPTGNDFSVLAEWEGESQRLSLPPPAEEVRVVSAVPSPAHDLRERGGDGDMVEPRPGGTARVPLLDAGEGVGTRQPVLHCSSTETWCPPRMDIK